MNLTEIGIELKAAVESADDVEVWRWVFADRNTWSEILDAVEHEAGLPNTAKKIEPAQSLDDVKRMLADKQKTLSWIMRRARTEYEDGHWEKGEAGWLKLLAWAFTSNHFSKDDVKYLLFREQGGGVLLSDDGSMESPKFGRSHVSAQEMEQAGTVQEFVQWLKANGAKQGTPRQMT